jgi:hypothetical protein
MRARHLMVIALACGACGQPLLHPGPWQPFRTGPGAALGRVWTDPTPRERAEVWVNVPASEPFPDSLLIGDFQRWARTVHLSRDSAAGNQPPGKYSLQLDIRRALTCPPRSDRCDAALRDAPRTLVYSVTLATCAGWPCHSGHLIAVRDTADRYLPADDIESWVE